MKNSTIKLVAVLAVMLSSCSKESCAYLGKCTPAQPEGYMVNTFNLSSLTNVGAIYQTTYNSNALVGSDWNAISMGAAKVVEVVPSRWNISDIGQVFGITLDNTGGIYLAASKLYNLDYHQVPVNFGSAGSAGIYKTDVTSLVTTDLVTTDVFTNTNTVGTSKIPNSDASLGNLAFDIDHNQFFVTNLEDGRIYRIDAVTGIVKSIFDPFVQDSGTISNPTPTAGMVNPGEQLWGIGVLNQKGKISVYFARTLTAGPAPSGNSFDGTLGTKEIWSIDLDGSGEFAATEVGATKLFITSSSQPKLQIPNVPGTQAKVTDIAFSCSGKMLLAERGAPHVSKVLEYVQSGGTWINGSNFYTGDYATGDNSAGGVDYGDRENAGDFKRDDIVWATANAMNYNNGSGVVLYGVQGMSSSGNSSITSANTTTDLFIDYDHIYTTTEKGGHGDVEIFDSSCPCNEGSTDNPTTGGN